MFYKIGQWVMFLATGRMPMRQSDLVSRIVADLRDEAHLAICKAMEVPHIDLKATEANCQMIETVADYIEERYAHDAYTTG